MVRKSILSLAVLALTLLSLNLVSSFVLNGTVYDSNRNYLNNSNISVMIHNITNNLQQISINSTASNESGIFSLPLTEASDLGYYLVVTHKNSTTNSIDFIGQSLPLFPYSQFSQLSNVNFYLQEAGTINITVRNQTDKLTSGYAAQIKDAKLGYPVYCTPGQVGVQYFCSVARNRNYSIMVYPSSGSSEQFVPVSFNWNNFYASSNYNVTDNLGTNFSTYNSTSRTLHKQFNVTESYAGITGYVQNTTTVQNTTARNSWANLTIVPFLLEPGNMIFMSYGTLPYNASAWRSQTDFYNFTDGFYNITVPYSKAETINYLLFASAQNSTFYGGYKNITVTGNAQHNVSLYGLLGDSNHINMSKSTGGVYQVSTKRQPFNLLNSTNSSLSMSAHVEATVDYTNYGATEFTFMEELSSQSSFSLPLLNVTGVKEINIYSPTYAPKRVGTKSAIQILSNNNITIKTFSPGGIGSALTSSSVNLYAYVSNSSCDIPSPPASCLLTNFTMATAPQRMLPIIIGGGKISLRMSYSGISVHYVNVDMLASGPPDADFDSSTPSSRSSSAFDAAMRFGSQGPTIYDYVLVSVPYTETAGSGLNDSAQVNVSVPVLYDEDWHPIWNTTANGTSSANLAGNYSHYSQHQNGWGNLTTPSICNPRNLSLASQINSTVPCNIDNSSNTLWIRIPHFSGTGITASGSLVPAAAASEDDSSGGSTGAVDSPWTSTIQITNEQFSSGYTRELNLRHRIKYLINSSSHYVGLVAITSSQATINISSTPQQAVFNIGDEKRFEVSGDNFYDLLVKLNSINNSKANITIQSIREEITIVAPLDEATQDSEGADGTVSDILEGTKNILKSWIFWGVVGAIIIVAGLLIFFLFFKKKRYYRKGY